jgi:DNA-binding NtrC family response regulator
LLVSERHKREIHLVVTDVVMPRTNGKVFVTRWAQIRPGVKVLRVSGYADNAIVHRGVLDPGTQFIGKPFSAGALMRKVRQVLDTPAA